MKLPAKVARRYIAVRNSVNTIYRMDDKITCAACELTPATIHHILWKCKAQNNVRNEFLAAAWETHENIATTMRELNDHQKTKFILGQGARVFKGPEWESFQVKAAYYVYNITNTPK